MNLKLLVLSIMLVLATSGCNFQEEHIRSSRLSSNETKSDDYLHNDFNFIHNELVRVQNQKMAYMFNDEKKIVTATLKYNDNQNYSIYLFPNYEMVNVNSNKDIIYFTKDDSGFMRIELLPDNVNWDTVKERTRAQLSEISILVHTQNIRKKRKLDYITILETQDSEQIVTSYLINNPEMKLKLTMYTHKNVDHRDAFFQMSKTILKDTTRLNHQ
jgi:hypothetical protein